MQTLPADMGSIDSQMKEYSIVRLSKNNLADVAWLHAEVYKMKTAPVNYFLRKYDTAYTGSGYVGFVAYNRENIPIAFYGVIPCLLRYNYVTILAAQSADTMTHPKHRYKGMFVELSNMTFDLCRELNIRLVFGFPNQNSYHGAVHKLGWKMTDTLDYFSISVKAFPLEKITGRFSLLKGIYEKYQRSVLKKYLADQKGVPHSAVPDGFATIYRSEEYFNYKTYSPTEVVSLAGTTVWISRKYGLSIGDIAGANEKNFTMVMEEVKKLARRLGIKQVQFHCSRGTHLHSLFSAYISPSPSYPALFQDFGSPVPPEKIKFTFADIDIF
jgi:hypothetical protein